MKIYDYQQAFGAADKTSKAMKEAVESWFDAYYQKTQTAASDPCQRIAYTIVNKIVKAVFGEYQTSARDKAARQLLDKLEEKKKEALQLALIGGECYLKPCPEEDGFSFTLIPRNRVLIFARNEKGEPTDIGTVQCLTGGNDYFTLLERRWLDEAGLLRIENRLFRSRNPQSLGNQVPLTAVKEFEHLPDSYRFEVPLGGLGIARMKTPILNCVDGSEDGVAVFAPAMGLIRNIDQNEAQLVGEFSRGESRIIASADLLDKEQGLAEHLFVGLDEDPEQVGITVFSPQLRFEAYLERKQEYLRNVESVVGLRRGMLSDTNMEDRTATEITSSAGDFNLTVMEFQSMWEEALGKILAICKVLGGLYGLPAIRDTAVSVDWGNSTLYDEDKLWQDYRQMVLDGLLAPEVALGWRFGLPADSEAERQTIRQKYMPN